MSTATKLVTVEEFWLQPDGEAQRNLLCGRVVEAPLPGARNGIIASTCGMYLRLWAIEHDSGVVGGRVGFVLARHPDTVRAPAAFFIQRGRLPKDGIPEAFWDFAPDLAVEIISSSELAEDVHEKVRDYLDAGTPLVWVVYPRTREVMAHTSDGLARTYRSDALLTDHAVLPGFSCIVKDLFE